MRITVVEVGPRDGLQNEPSVLSPSVRAELCNRLTATGISSIEAVSFVSPSRVPQMAGAEEVVGALEGRDKTFSRQDAHRLGASLVGEESIALERAHPDDLLPVQPLGELPGVIPHVEDDILEAQPGTQDASREVRTVVPASSCRVQRPGPGRHNWKPTVGPPEPVAPEGPRLPNGCLVLPHIAFVRRCPVTSDGGLVGDDQEQLKHRENV